MRINTNVGALNAANALSRAQNAVSSSMEKLSSGFRINKAADDAAGLGIANKLRADGRALSQASRNAEQTNSLLQVAEGATSTIQSVLERMKELATQSGSDTVDAAGRASINAEFTALRSEIDRTVSTTKFQGNALLDGSFGSTPAALNVSDIVSAAHGTAATGSYSLSVSGNVVTLTKPDSSTQTVDVSTLGAPDYSGGKVALKFGSGASQLTINVLADSANDITSVAAALNGKSFTVGSGAAATHTGALQTPVSGITIGTIGSAVADGSYNISATDRVSTLVGAQAGVSIGTINTAVAAGTYSVAVTDASAALSNSVSGFSGLAVSGGMAADSYTIEVDTTAKSITIKDSLGNTAASQTFASANDADPIAFSDSGFSFNLDGTGSTDTWAHIKSNLEAETIDVTAAKVEVKSGSTVVGSQDLTAGYAASGSFSFSNSGYGFSVDRTDSNANTYAKFKSALENTQIKVVDAHIDVKQGTTVVATQSYTPGAIAINQQINFSNSNIAFSVSAGLNTGFSTMKTALESQPLVVSSTLAGANSATAVSGNSTTRSAQMLVDASGAYKTNDMIQLSALNLTVSTLGLTSSDLSTAVGARTALSTIDSALSTVSTALGSIGANQNRISYAQENLKTKITNFAAAESVIRDVDMAEEMTKFSKNNILAQAGTAMLAQANQAGQGVLQLLRG